MPANAKKPVAPGLTKGKLVSLQDVFVDFIRYLFDSAKSYFQQSDPRGNLQWASIESNIHLILSHPNGWGGSEQRFLREAVVKASITTEKEAISRVSFVTEWEASVHFCATHMESDQSLEVSFFLFDSETQSYPQFQARTEDCDNRCQRADCRRRFLHRGLHVDARGGAFPRARV